MNSGDTNINQDSTSTNNPTEKEENKNENGGQAKEEVVESDFTKKYSYLVPSNDSIYGVHSYYAGYQGYNATFDYSANNYLTTPYNLYNATFASSVENSSTENLDTNDSNECNEEYFNHNYEENQGEYCGTYEEGDAVVNEEENVEESAYALNYQVAVDDDGERINDMLSEEVIQESEKRKRPLNEDNDEEEPARKRKDIIEETKKKLSNELPTSSKNLSSLGNDNIATSQHTSSKIKKSVKKSKNITICNDKVDDNPISHVVNKEKPVDIGHKLSQEMDISSILGTDISMGVSNLKPKVNEENAKESESKGNLKLRSSKKVVPKPKLKVVVPKESKNESSGKNELQYCDEKKTLIKIPGVKIGIVERKKLYLQLLNGLKQQGVEDDVARKLATAKEHRCASISADSSKYKSKCYNEIMKIKKRDCSPFVDKCVKKTQFSQEDMNKFHEYLKSFILTEEQLIANDYPIWDKVKINEIFYSSTGSINPRMTYAKEGDNERICSHCSKTFEINGRTLEPTKKDVICIYHSERLSFNFAKRDYDKAFSCCGGSSDSVGCKEANEHVTSTQPYSNLKLYKECPPCADDNTTKGVYALDCEMVLTTAGQDVARVTVVDMNSDVVFDQLIKPKYRITDYRTQFSGITEELLGTNAVSLEEAQQKLFKLVNQDTILIGHSLNCDLETLKIVHKNVVDTSVTFPHKNPKYKQSLKNIAKAYINMDIQEAHTGHDSAEDAIAAMKVLIAKYQGKI